MTGTGAGCGASRFRANTGGAAGIPAETFAPPEFQPGVGKIYTLRPLGVGKIYI
jgi:hypothetical protein